jgi:hypothetical protein
MSFGLFGDHAPCWREILGQNGGLKPIGADMGGVARMVMRACAPAR